MGAVYEVQHLETERRLALKVMLPHIVQSEEMRDRFRREARVAAQVESEHIVDTLDAGIDEATGVPFIVMELLRGEEVAKALRRVGRFGPVDTVTFLHQASLALDKTHRSHIVHRDLKPENLFLTEREDGHPRVKVLDFGIAKLLAEGSTQDPGTRSLGTPLYMAPEQFRAGHGISPATDIYALGMIAYTMLTGSSYWADEAKNSSNVFMFAGSVMAGPKEPATVRAHRLGVPLPPTFDPWFAIATAPASQDRFPSAGALVAALADALGVARPGAFNLSASGPFRVTGAALPAPALPPPALPPPPAAGAPLGTTGQDAASTLIYTGSNPQLGTSGVHASGPQPQAGYPGTGPQQPGYQATGPQQPGYQATGPQQPGYPGTGPQPGYQATGPQPGYQATGPQQAAYQATGPQRPSAPGYPGVPGATSTGSAYGLAAATGTGVGPAPAAGKGKVIAAVAIGLSLGGAGLVAILLSTRSAPPAPGGAPTVAITASAAVTAVTAPSSQPLASAAPTAGASPDAPSADPVASAAPTASAAPSASASPAARPAGAAPPAKKASPPPPPPGKKSIYVRD
jgi:serine/threonine-protein kinase